MDAVSSPASELNQPVLSLCTAMAVVTFGTALVDPARIRLLLVPLSFLITAFGAGTLVGRAVARQCPQSTRSPVLELAVRIGSGIACLSLIAVASALCGVLWIAGVAALPLLAVGLWEVRHTRFPLRPLGWLLTDAAGGLVMGSAWLVAWLWATIPPTFFDELAYHLVIPQRSLATGELQMTPWVFFTLMPHASDLLLAWGMVMDKELGARAVHFALWVACSLAAWGLAEAIAWPRPSSWSAPAVAGALAASPMLWFLATLSFAETCLSVAVVTAAALLAASHTAPRPWLSLGLALGLAATVKLAGFMWVIAGVAAAVVAGWPRWDLARAALVALGSVAPWWVRATVHTGNPIYPMAFGLLGGIPWSDESQARLKGGLPAGASDLGLEGILRLPLDLVQHPERFGSASEVGVLAISAVCLVLALPALSRLTHLETRWRRLSDAAASFILVAGIGWVLTSTTARFFAPALIVSLAVLAGALLHLRGVSRALAIVVLLTAGVWGAGRFIEQQAAVFSSTNVALGRETAEDYLVRRLDHFPAARFVREQLPAHARLLFIGETRPYYFDREALAPSAYDRHPLHRWVLESSSPEALAARLATEGITHVVLNVREFKRLRDSYGLLVFTGEGADANDRRLKELPRALRTLYKERGVYVFEVPTRVAKSGSVGS